MFVSPGLIHTESQSKNYGVGFVMGYSTYW
jgi:hypothetical protein